MSDVLDLLTELIRFRTIGGGEGAAARHCAALLEKAGLGAQLLAWEPGRDQLVARTSEFVCGTDGRTVTLSQSDFGRACVVVCCLSADGKDILRRCAFMTFCVALPARSPGRN